MAELSRGEFKQILARQSDQDLKYILALLKRDGVLTIEPERKPGEVGVHPPDAAPPTPPHRPPDIKKESDG